MAALTWHCHVCGAERPDDKIGVCSRTSGIMTVNVRYCNDVEACEAGAPRVATAWIETANRQSVGR